MPSLVLTPRHEPELLFTLRKVDQQDLIAQAGSDLSKKHKRPARAKVLVSDDLSEMFGIEMAPATSPARTAAVRTAATKSSTAASSETSSPQTRAITAAKPSESALKRRDAKPLTPARRRAISLRMRKFWAARRALLKKRKASESS